MLVLNAINEPDEMGGGVLRLAILIKWVIIKDWVKQK